MTVKKLKDLLNAAPDETMEVLVRIETENEITGNVFGILSTDISAGCIETERFMIDCG